MVYSDKGGAGGSFPRPRSRLVVRRTPRLLLAALLADATSALTDLDALKPLRTDYRAAVSLALPMLLAGLAVLGALPMLSRLAVLFPLAVLARLAVLFPLAVLARLAVLCALAVLTQGADLRRAADLPLLAQDGELPRPADLSGSARGGHRSGLPFRLDAALRGGLGRGVRRGRLLFVCAAATAGHADPVEEDIDIHFVAAGPRRTRLGFRRDTAPQNDGRHGGPDTLGIHSLLSR